LSAMTALLQPLILGNEAHYYRDSTDGGRPNVRRLYLCAVSLGSLGNNMLGPTMDTLASSP
jgi:hypothetical protein